MKAFFDSSALVKRYVPETGSEEVMAICGRASQLGVSVICHVEIASALCRLRREGFLNGPQYSRYKLAVAQDLRDAFVCNIDEGSVVRCISLLEENPLRGMDALHVAAALEWEADLFISGDARQAQAAKKAGLKVRALS